MKKIVLGFLVFFLSVGLFQAQTDKLDELFKKFERSGKVTSIDIKKPMFSLLKSIDLNDDYINKIKPILSQVDGIKMVVLTKATYPESLKNENLEIEKLNIQKVDRVNAALDDLHFQELMSVTNNGAKMKFLAEAEKGGFLENLIFNIDSKEENIIFLLNGKMKMSDVSKIINGGSSVFVPIENGSKKESNDSYLTGEARQVSDFTGIKVNTGINVVFKQDNQKSVKVIADSDKLKYIVTKVENGILDVRLDTKGEKNLRFKNLSVTISNPDLSVVKTSSGASFKVVDKVVTENLSLEATSGSSIQGIYIAKNKADLTATSGASLKSTINTPKMNVISTSGSSSTVEGLVDDMNFEVSSGASFKGEKLKVNEAVGGASSGASVSLNVVKKLTVSASSGGSVKYKGNPVIDSNIKKISGGSLSQIP